MPSTSGTKNWTLQVDELIVEALERVGGKFNSAEEMQSCMRSLNLVLKDMMNRGKPLFTIEQKTLNMVTSVASYTLPVGEAYVLGPVMRVSGVDYPMNRMSFLDYQNISTKETQGRPTQFTIESGVNQITMKVWPVPDDQQTRQIVYFACEDPDDVTKLPQAMDINRRYLPCITSGLAYFMYLKKPEELKNLQYLEVLRRDYETQLETSFQEDRELTSFVVTPVNYGRYF